MFNELFSSIFAADAETALTPRRFLLCLGAALALGLGLALTCTYKNKTTRSFAFALALLPAAVSVVVMLVNGNLGAGVAVAGAFGLVRFRSAPGTAKEIVSIFTAMAAGLLLGMGYLAYAALFSLIMGLFFLVLSAVKFGENQPPTRDRTLKITVPEDLNFTGLFTDVFEKYTSACRQTGVKTTHMGSLFRISYEITLKDLACEKDLIDALRERNGNLEITLTEAEDAQTF